MCVCVQVLGSDMQCNLVQYLGHFFREKFIKPSEIYEQFSVVRLTLVIWHVHNPECTQCFRYIYLFFLVREIVPLSSC